MTSPGSSAGIAKLNPSNSFITCLPAYISVFCVHECALTCIYVPVGVHVCTIKLGFPLVDYFCSLPLLEFGEVAMTEERAEAATTAVKGPLREIRERKQRQQR